MKISNKQIANAVVQDLRLGKNQKQVAKALAAYLLVERRSKDADAIAREIERILSQSGQVELTVTTTHGLGDSERKIITDLFAETSKRIVINEIQDPTVLGGVLVESGERRLDLTVRRQIQRLKGVRV